MLIFRKVKKKKPEREERAFKKRKHMKKIQLSFTSINIQNICEVNGNKL